jgi:hypothetical protein
MRTTERVLALHQRRLEDLMAEQRAADVHAKRDQEDADGLQHSAREMALILKIALYSAFT